MAWKGDEEMSLGEFVVGFFVVSVASAALTWFVCWLIDLTRQKRRASDY